MPILGVACNFGIGIVLCAPKPARHHHLLTFLTHSNPDFTIEELDDFPMVAKIHFPPPPKMLETFPVNPEEYFFVINGRKRRIEKALQNLKKYHESVSNYEGPNRSFAIHMRRTQVKDQGFYDENFKYLTRAQAFEEAKKHNQFVERGPISKAMLFSEDVW